MSDDRDLTERHPAILVGAILAVLVAFVAWVTLTMLDVDEPSVRPMPSAPLTTP